MLQRNALQAESAAPGAKEEEIDLLALAGALWRGKLIIALCGLIALAIGGWYAYVVAIPTYRANTALVLEIQSEPLVDIGTIVTGASGEEKAMSTEVSIIRSRRVLEPVVQQLNLTEDPEFNAALRPDPGVTIDTFLDLIPGTEVSEAPPEVLANDPAALTRTINTLRNATAASIQRGTYIFDISVTTQSPQKSQRIADAMAEAYLAQQIDQKYATTETAVTWLSERVVELEEELRAREDEARALRMEIDVVSLEGVEALNRQLIDARDRAATSAANVATSQARLSRATDLRTAGDYAGLAQLLRDPSLSALAENEAATAASLEARSDALITRLESELDRQRRQAEALAGSVDQLEGQVNAQSEDLVQLQQIERELQATRTLYETFLTRLKEATIQRGLAQPDSFVLSQASPGSYVAPRKSRIMAISLLLGLMAGAAIVLGRQFLHKGYRDADELESATSRPVLGEIPLMPIKRRDQLIRYLNDKPASAAAEAIRNLRTSILLASSSGPPQVIMSTSALPGEGKTTQAVALAHNLAGLNKKVLLIEGDVRRRVMDEYFRLPKEPRGGLVSFLQTGGDVRDLPGFITRDPEFDVDILLGEKTPQNAADLFASDTFRTFLDTLRDHYDHIVIDTPPVLVVPDARVIGQQVDVILFSVAWNRTSRVQVKAALRQFATVNLVVDGLVLSQINAADSKRYGYGGKYGRYAAYGSAYYDT